jgi:hypothetical protein
MSACADRTRAHAHSLSIYVLSLTRCVAPSLRSITSDPSLSRRSLQRSLSPPRVIEPTVPHSFPPRSPPLSSLVGMSHSRPSSAPVRGVHSPQPAAAGFIHRDIFASGVPGGPPIDVAASFQSPKHRKQQGSEPSIIPSASKLDRWNTKLGSYRQSAWRCDANERVRALVATAELT